MYVCVCVCVRVEITNVEGGGTSSGTGLGRMGGGGGGHSVGFLIGFSKCFWVFGVLSGVQAGGLCSRGETESLALAGGNGQA